MTKEEYLKRGAGIALKEMLWEVFRFLKEYMNVSFEHSLFGAHTFETSFTDNQGVGNGTILVRRQGQHPITVRYSMRLGQGSMLCEHEWCTAEISVDVPSTGRYFFSCNRTSTLCRVRFTKVSQ